MKPPEELYRFLDIGKEEIVGTWGYGSFENDHAMDWASNFSTSGSLVDLERTTSLREGTRDVRACELALAAAEVVAACGGFAAARLPERISVWVSRNPQAPSKKLLDSAIAIITEIGSASSLRDLWEETGDEAEWLSTIEDLKNRLRRSSSAIGSSGSERE